MGYVDENLMPGEVVIHLARLHRFTFVAPLVFALLGLALAIASHGADELMALACIGGFLVVGGGILFLVRLIEYKTSEFAVTNKRVIVKVGLLRRRTLELLLQKVETVGVDQPILGRLLGFGTIVVTGTGGTKEPFANIADPLEFRRQVQEQAHNSSSFVTTTAPVASSLQSPPDSRFCTQCGAKNPSGSRFCSSCAAPIV